MSHLVNCKTCGSEIANTASVCPHCGGRRPPILRYPVACCLIIVFSVVCGLLMMAVIREVFSASNATVGFYVPTYSQSEQSKLLCYSDSNIEIYYKGCRLRNTPWMTERGMENLDIMAVDLEITNKTDILYVVISSETRIDGKDYSDGFVSYSVFADSTDDYSFFCPNLTYDNPSEIFMELEVSDYLEPITMKPYQIEFTINP